MAEYIELENGQIALYKRERSSVWQYRYKVSDGNFRRRSSGKHGLDDAKKIAIEDFQHLRVVEKHGYIVQPNGSGVVRFSDVCRQYSIKLQGQIADGFGKPIYKSYLGVVDNWLIPFFGQKAIGNISDGDIDDFSDFRRKKLGKEPAKSTINTHNVVLRAIFGFAATKKYIKRSDIPVFSVKGLGRRGKRRCHFSEEDYISLYRFMRRWVKCTGLRWESVYKRMLLREYVLFLANTGIRPGREALSLRWKSIEEEWLPSNGRDRRYVRIAVQGKTGGRKVIARACVRDYLRRVRIITNKVEPDDLVFCMPDGSPPKDFSAMFTRLLEDGELLYDRTGERRSLYSLRHTYATFRLASAKTNCRRLAKQMGTSINMIEKHYGHDEPEHYPDEFDR